MFYVECLKLVLELFIPSIASACKSCPFPIMAGFGSCCRNLRRILSDSIYFIFYSKSSESHSHCHRVHLSWTKSIERGHCFGEACRKPKT